MIGDQLRTAMLSAAVTLMSAGVEVHLHTGDPGTDGTEHALDPGSGYAHLSGVTFAVVGSAIQSVAAAVLGVRSGGENVTLTHFSVWSRTQLVIAGPLDAPVAYQVGELPPGFAPGGIRMIVK